MSDDGNIITIQLSEIEYLRSAHVKACEALGDAEAENDRLREALERIAHIRHEVFVRNPQTLREAKDIANEALSKEAGQ